MNMKQSYKEHLGIIGWKVWIVGIVMAYSLAMLLKLWGIPTLVDNLFVFFPLAFVGVVIGDFFFWFARR